MNIVKPDSISLTTHHIHLRFHNNVLASGSAFVYERNKRRYLITNWHNVSGKNPLTRKCLSETGGVPNVLSTMYRTSDNPGICCRRDMNLYHDMENLLWPIWLEHLEYRERVDVVAIPLDEVDLSGLTTFPINAIDFSDGFKLEVADQAFVIGYPFNEVKHLELPIWKSASIASEPDLNLDKLPKLLIDTATRAGLSGSPVIMQRSGVHGLSETGDMKDDSIIGTIRNFVGVYSGRIVPKDELEAQLGIVWKKEVIDEIIDQ